MNCVLKAFPGVLPLVSVSAIFVGCAWGQPGGSQGRTFIFQDPVFWIVVLVVGVGALISKLRGDE